MGKTLRGASVVISGVALATLQVASAQGPEKPEFKSLLAWDQGYLVVDPENSGLSLSTSAPVYEGCGLSPKAIKSELVRYLNGVLHTIGPGLEAAALPPAQSDEAKQTLLRAESVFRELERTDPATRLLLTFTGSWNDGKAKMRAWELQHGRATPRAAATRTVDVADLYKAAQKNALLADGPLLPVAFEEGGVAENDAFVAGQLPFFLAPPLLGIEARLRPVRNVTQWEGLRGDMAAEALEPLRCKLWYRQQVVDGLQDYLEVRGLSAEDYRSPRDDRDDKGLSNPPVKKPPTNSAGLAPERPRFADDGGYGGRVLLLPDPLVKTVFIETGETKRSVLWPALYLLLPTPDLALIRANPASFLCRTQAVWKPSVDNKSPAAVRLDLDTDAGKRLAFSRLYLSPRELAVRMQRLQTINYQAGIKFTTDVPAERLRWTTLIIEPLEGAQGTSPVGALEPSIADCADAPPDAGTAIERLPDPGQTDHPEPASVHKRLQPYSFKNALQLSAEKPSGKPLAVGIAYSHEGMQPNDLFSIGIGHQRRPSGDATYSRDFVGFDWLHRRLQLYGRVYSTQQVDRPVENEERRDERRDGIDLHATLDLWRDIGSSFGQVDLSLKQARIKAERGDTLPHVTMADATLIAVRDRPGTSASSHAEAALLLGVGRSGGQNFGKTGLELAYQQFVRAFDRIDLRGHIAAVGSKAPLSERVPFGGEDSVRGYRSEYALVHRTASIQTEYWVPVPSASSAPEAITRLLRRNVALAAFFDVGAIARSETTQRHLYAGAGLGLRYTQAASRLTLKLDIARPVRVDGALPQQERRWQFYFSIGTQRSL